MAVTLSLKFSINILSQQISPFNIKIQSLMNLSNLKQQQNKHLNQIIYMNTQVSLSRNTSPRPVTSLGIYSNDHLDEQLKGLSSSAKSIKQFMINGQYYAQGHKQQHHRQQFKQHNVDNEECHGQGQKQPSICRMRMQMRKCVEQSSNHEDSVLRSHMDSLDMQYPCRQSLSPRNREYQVVTNKYKSNLQYLQTQLKQIYNIHTYQSIMEESRQIKTEMSKLQSQIRKLKLEVNELKNVRSKVQTNTARIQELRYLIANQKKLLNKLNIRELELEDYLGRDNKHYPQIYEEASLEDIEEISKVERANGKITMRHNKEKKSMVNSKYKKQNIKLTDISQCNSSYYVKMKESVGSNPVEISDIINNSAFMLKNVNYQPETNPFEKQQECTSSTVKDSRNQQEHKNILKERIRILEQSILSRTEDFVRRIELLKKEKVCLKKIVQIIRINTINTETQKRKLNKVVLRQKSQTTFRSKLKNGQKITPNKSEKNNIFFAFGQHPENSRQDSLSNQMRNLIYENTHHDYQLGKSRPAIGKNSRSEEKEKRLRKFTGSSQKKLWCFNQNTSEKEKYVDAKFTEEYCMVELTQ